MIEPRIALLAVVAVLAASACANPLVGDWTETNREIENATADFTMRFDADQSFTFEVIAHRSVSSTLFPGCNTTMTMSGFVWSDDPSTRRFTVTPSAAARITFSASGCADPRSNVASSVTQHAGDPPVTIDYAATDTGLFVSGELGGWHFRALRLSLHTAP